MSELSALLSAAAHGDRLATADFLARMYDELRALAVGRMATEPAGHSLDPSGLVHEAYLRLFGAGADPRWADRNHFLALASTAMRRVLVDHARSRARMKRGGARLRVPLQDVAVGPLSHDVLDLDQALTALADEYPRKARLVELRYFAGMTEQEAADALGISRATAVRDWEFARAWLYDKLNTDDGRPE